MLFYKSLFSLSIMDLHTRERHWRCLMTSRQLFNISLALYISYTETRLHSRTRIVIQIYGHQQEAAPFVFFFSIPFSFVSVDFFSKIHFECWRARPRTIKNFDKKKKKQGPTRFFFSFSLLLYYSSHHSAAGTMRYKGTLQFLFPILLKQYNREYQGKKSCPLRKNEELRATTKEKEEKHERNNNDSSPCVCVCCPVVSRFIDSSMHNNNRSSNGKKEQKK